MIDVALLGIIRHWHLRDQVPLREIAKRLGISRNTVRRYLRSEITEPVYAERQSASAIDAYAFQLSGWLKTEAAKFRKQRRSLKQLREELINLGFKGSYDRVAAFARQWRESQTEWVNSARKRTLVPYKRKGQPPWLTFSIQSQLLRQKSQLLWQKSQLLWHFTSFSSHALAFKACRHKAFVTCQ
ncbi:helix-turn-helix domain-containing protein [Undibacterium terreum]|uniref:HTH IS21-type domain-containing protein n=1 Tax=Undibacterium terreum TaxID=1224302 RepID=A0A916UTP1_9BURK|nr:hypothetical protein GCM10011396_38210 [Undibacterium terreum]